MQNVKERIIGFVCATVMLITMIPTALLTSAVEISADGTTLTVNSWNERTTSMDKGTVNTNSGKTAVKLSNSGTVYIPITVNNAGTCSVVLPGAKGSGQGSVAFYTDADTEYTKGYTKSTFDVSNWSAADRDMGTATLEAGTYYIRLKANSGEVQVYDIVLTSSTNMFGAKEESSEVESSVVESSEVESSEVESSETESSTPDESKVEVEVTETIWTGLVTTSGWEEAEGDRNLSFDNKLDEFTTVTAITFVLEAGSQFQLNWGSSPFNDYNNVSTPGTFTVTDAEQIQYIINNNGIAVNGDNIEVVEVKATGTKAVVPDDSSIPEEESSVVVEDSSIPEEESSVVVEDSSVPEEESSVVVEDSSVADDSSVVDAEETVIAELDTITDFGWNDNNVIDFNLEDYESAKIVVEGNVGQLKLGVGPDWTELGTFSVDGTFTYEFTAEQMVAFAQDCKLHLQGQDGAPTSAKIVGVKKDSADVVDRVTETIWTGLVTTSGWEEAEGDRNLSFGKKLNKFESISKIEFVLEEGSQIQLNWGEAPFDSYRDITTPGKFTVTDAEQIQFIIDNAGVAVNGDNIKLTEVRVTGVKAPVVELEYTIVYEDMFGNELMQYTIMSAEDEVKAEPCTVNLNVQGYTFKGWAMVTSSLQVIDDPTEIVLTPGTTRFVARYEVTESTHNVTVEGGRLYVKADENDEAYTEKVNTALNYVVPNYAKIKLVAPETNADGETFNYWMLNGFIYSQDRELFFSTWADANFEAYYNTNAMAPTPYAYIGETAILSGFESEGNADNKITFNCAFYVPADVTVEAVGVIYTNAAGYNDLMGLEDSTVPSSCVVVNVNYDELVNGQTMVSLTGTSNTAKRYARAFIKYTLNGESFVTYSQSVAVKE